MKKLFISLVVLLMLNICALAQHQAKVKALAQLVATATLKGDFKTVIDHTDPETVKAAGGRDAMVKVMERVFTQMKKQGAYVKSATAGEPGAIVTVNGKLFCLVPEIVGMAVPQSSMMPKGVYTAQSTLLALSTDNGKNWYFVGSGSINEEAIYKKFPELKGKIVFPKPVPPQFTPEA
ncbi:hypothetical protein HQ865_22575 [Mucilaginibacter mali]|uniref:Uncharacterized protein n=1 Tax=Mucilaginibacter mali TaxID=2740462 RepID=A0A7D4QWQ7_9SPHI|nr:hypothetical protein [Mucilaginibacter mali]QKJ32429.1 hypothetical protein HQ865_22575 [Mucilaginibacter mali]